MIKSLLMLSPRQKRVVLSIMDGTLLYIALFAAIFIHSGHSALISANVQKFLLCSVIITASSLFTFKFLGCYRTVIRYMGQHMVFALMLGVLLTVIAMALIGTALGWIIDPAALLIYWSLATVLLCGYRLTWRSLCQYIYLKHKEKVAIYGAGDAGMQLCFSLLQSRQYRPVVFIDEDPEKQGEEINGLQVCPLHQIEEVLIDNGVSRLFLALDRRATVNHEMVRKKLAQLTFDIVVIPSADELVEGRQFEEVQPDIDIAKLLGRDEIYPDSRLLANFTFGKVVMVTGAGGTIGAGLCRQLITFSPATLVLLDVSEYGLYRITQQLESMVNSHGLQTTLKPVLGTVQEQARLQVIMQSFGVDTVYHAAGYRRTPLVEKNLIEAVKINVFGALHAGEAAARARVNNFILISTYEANQPANILAASKRLAEQLIQRLAANQHTTRFSTIRLNHVINHRDSILPLFLEQISKGGPVTVSHPQTCRDFMLPREVAQFIIQAGAMQSQGALLMLNTGNPVRIDDIASRLIEQLGLTVCDQTTPGEIEIVHTGLRRDERLIEDTFATGEWERTEFPCIYRLNEKDVAWSALESDISTLEKACGEFDCEAVWSVLRGTAGELNTSGQIEDLIWKHNRLTHASGAKSAVDLAERSAARISRSIPL